MASVILVHYTKCPSKELGHSVCQDSLNVMQTRVGGILHKAGNHQFAASGSLTKVRHTSKKKYFVPGHSAVVRALVRYCVIP